MMRKDRSATPKDSVCLGVGLLIASLTAAQAAGDPPSVPVIVDRAACLRLIDTPAGTTGDAAYRPGVDVHGRPVVPAEGPGGPEHDWLPDPIRIQLTVPLAKKLGLGDGATNFEADAVLGDLTVRDGRVRLDGRTVASSAVPELREACRRLEVLQDAATERKPR